MTNAPDKKSIESVLRKRLDYSKFLGTSNPRELRAIHACMIRPMSREHLDRAVGCSNAPDLVMRLRAKGLEFPCVKVDDIDRDGMPIRRGVYYFTDKDRKKINLWLSTRRSI